MSIRSGDEVVVIAGKDRGKRGRVTRVLIEKNRVIVDGVNMVKRHLRRQPGSLQAGIIDMPAPMSRANVMLICPNCNEPSRASRSILPDGTHVRNCKKCGETFDKER
ncbi:MAG: 50S ribosomal protein L24 [Chloroflexota bacterium]|nr:MAG: 50S ribosomal protein L24 [Chloroflexota bacterium]